MYKPTFTKTKIAVAQLCAAHAFGGRGLQHCARAIALIGEKACLIHTTNTSAGEHAEILGSDIATCPAPKSRSAQCYSVYPILASNS